MLVATRNLQKRLLKKIKTKLCDRKLTQVRTVDTQFLHMFCEGKKKSQGKQLYSFIIRPRIINRQQYMRDRFVQVRLRLFSLHLLKHLVADFVEHVEFLKETDRPLDVLSNMTRPMSFCVA